MSAQRPIGFVGLGNMGWPMAANLARAGRSLVVRDVDADRQASFVEEFGAVSGTDLAAFRDVDAVITMLPDGGAVRAALIASTIADQLQPGTVVVESSSADPLDTRALAADLIGRGIPVVDAPVSGGIARATDGTLSIMLGSDDAAAADRATAILAPVSSVVFRTGALGSGHVMKTLNNYVLAAGFVAASEALILGTKFGLRPDIVLQVLNQSSGRNVSTETTLVEQVLTGRYAANFTLGLFAKDLGIAADLANSLGVNAPLTSTTHQRLADALQTLGSSVDYTEMVRLWADRAGVEPSLRQVPPQQVAPSTGDHA